MTRTGQEISDQPDSDRIRSNYQNFQLFATITIRKRAKVIVNLRNKFYYHERLLLQRQQRWARDNIEQRVTTK